MGQKKVYEILKKNKGKWMTTKEVIKQYQEKCNESNISKALRLLYEAYPKQILKREDQETCINKKNIKSKRMVVKFKFN